ncbi:hypothetical protein [Erythrobacter sp. R86502]|uniref:hypothetical protein n=1 Tax=Erythrobacter sp. R86502 TaxID=3093846 RepID=UPI0036D3674C
MLARMIIGGQAMLAGAGQGPVPDAADYVVSNDGEWDAVFANSAATLSGKIVEVRGSSFTPRTITNRDMHAQGASLTLRCADAASRIPALTLSGTVRGIDFSAFNFQMAGWPRLASACLTFGTGTFGKLRFINGTRFRHGYGAGLADIDTSAELPEYARIAHVQTATTTSATYPLTWQNPASSGGIIEFFNRGTNSVRVAVGGDGVVATGSSQLVAPGARYRFTGLVPASATHFAVLATTGTSEVNARAEIGLGGYLADAFAASGAADVESLYFRNVVMRDLSNAFKSMGQPNSLVIMDCDIDRIYQDIIASVPRPGTGVAYYLRNIESLPFARSGIGESENGDAGDPHGDQFQGFANGSGAVGPIYFAGNRVHPGNLRSDVQSQGVLMRDNAFSPSYKNAYFISSMWVGGAPIGMAMGFTKYPAVDTLIYGALIANWRNPGDVNTRLILYSDDSGSLYVGKTLTAEYQPLLGTIVTDDLLRILDTPDPSAVLPAIAGLSGVARTRAAIEGVIGTAAEGTGLGPVATANAVDWTTGDHTAVILWENVPSGAHWNGLTQQPLGTLTILPLRKILNRRASQAVSVGPGTEWRSVDTDGTTQLQGWTTSAGTIQPDQFIQIRATSASVGSTVVSASVTINGFAQSVDITTANIPAVSLVMPSPAARFEDTANTPALTNRMTFRGKFFFPDTASIGNGDRIVSQGFNNCYVDLVGGGGPVRINLTDSAGASLLSSSTLRFTGGIVPATWLDIVFDVNIALGQATLTINGVTETYPFLTPGNGQFATAKFNMLARGAGLVEVNPGVRFADLSIDFNGALRKAIPNDAAAANADAWKQGTGVFTNA